MSRYKMPRKFAIKLATKDQSLKQVLHGAIKSFSHDHPEWAVPGDARTSLVKRLEGQMKSVFARILADREVLDWLEAHRYEWPELCKLQGGLRKAIAEEMERRKELPEDE
jgi:hypothetical protein